MSHRREQLISQVKTAYAEMADHESRTEFIDQSDPQQPPEPYYERQLQEVIGDIQAGVYDDAPPTFNIIEYLANQKNKPARILDSISGTLQNMELADELMVEINNKRKLRELATQNERRAAALDSFKRELAESQAEEILEQE